MTLSYEDLEKMNVYLCLTIAKLEQEKGELEQKLEQREYNQRYTNRKFIPPISKEQVQDASKRVNKK